MQSSVMPSPKVDTGMVGASHLDQAVTARWHAKAIVFQSVPIGVRQMLEVPDRFSASFRENYPKTCY